VAPPAPVRPDYDGTGVAGIVPALLGGDRSTLPEPARSADAVVLLVLDGLGWGALQAERARLPVLSSLVGGPVTTVAPSTTAAALTSISTGMAPSEHGLIGFRVRVDGRVLNALAWQSEGKRPPDPVLVQRCPPFRNREVAVVTKAEFRTSGFTEAHLRGGRFVGWRTASELVEHCRRLVTEGEPFVYAYYPGIDEIAHLHGLHDDYYRAELAFADRLVGDVLAALPASAALMVTADHGQVHVGPEGWRALGPVEELVDACSGDGRFRYLHARRGAHDEVLAGARAEHGQHAWVLSQEELIDEGWLGPPPGAVVRRRLGDVVIAPFAPVAIVDRTLPREAQLVSAHGSLTAAEMQVPLVAGRGGT